MTEKLKEALKIEIQAWKMHYGKQLNSIYKAKLDEIAEFEEEHSRKLAHPINDLEDVRQAMAALESIRNNQIEMDMLLGPLEVSFFQIT